MWKIKFPVLFKFPVLLMFVCIHTFHTIHIWAAPAPKAPSSELLATAPLHTQSAVDASQLSYVADPEGNPLLLLRFQPPQGSATQLLFRNVRLPEQSVLFVYGIDENGQLAGKAQSFQPGSISEEFWTEAIVGTQVIVELQLNGEIPGDVPFEISELVPAESSEPLAVVEDQQETESRTGNFRGTELTYEIKDGLAFFEGDIFLGETQELDRSPKQVFNEAVAITGSRWRWPGGVIPYQISSTLSNQQRVVGAVAHWNNTFGGLVRLVPRISQSNYVLFQRSSGCSSAVGFLAAGAQPIYVGDSCTQGNVIHEIGHTVGLWHEQGRQDRNSRIRVLWDNIKSSSVSGFGQNIYNGDDIGSYDYNSVMHYSAYAFSANGKPTIETIPPGIPIGQRRGLSAGDIAAVRKLYGGGSAPLLSAPLSTPAPAPAPSPVQDVSTTIATNPSGVVAFQVDGVTYSASHTFSWTPGSTHTVSVPASISGQTVLSFVRWNNGGARIQTITASSSLPRLLADFTQSHLLTAVASPAGTGTVHTSPAAGYLPMNTSVSLQAVPQPGYCFSSWSGLTAGTPWSTAVTMSRPYNIQANFQTGAFSLSPASNNPGETGGRYTLGVSASSGCAWTAQTTASWITIVSGKSGSGSGVLTYEVVRNASNQARVGIISVAGKVHLITQRGQD